MMQVPVEKFPSSHNTLSQPSQTSITSASLVVNSALNDPILGGFLSDLTDRLNAVISGAMQNASDDVNRLLIQAGNEVQLAIQNAVNAFQPVIDKAISSLDSTVQGVTNQLQSLVEQVEQKETDVLGQIQQTVMDLISGLPMADRQTRFTTVTPQFIPISSDMTSVKVSMIGLFRFATSFVPTLTIGNHSCTVLQIKDTKIDFAIPVTTLVSGPIDSPLRTFTYVNATFNAPWNNGITEIQARFPTWIGILPSTPGLITLTYQATSTGRRTQLAQTSPAYFAGAEHRGPTIHPSFTYYPHTGWKYSKEPTVVIESHIGHVIVQSVVLSPNADQCVVTFELGGGDWSNVGRVNYHLLWDEYQDYQQSQTRTVTVNDLFWGDSRLFTPAQGEELQKIHLDAFTGKRYDFLPATDSSNPYIKLIAQNGEVLISTTIPNGDDLNFTATKKATLDVTANSKKTDSMSKEDKQSLVKTFLTQKKTELAKHQEVYQKLKTKYEKGLKEQTDMMKQAQTLRDRRFVSLDPDYAILQTKNMKKLGELNAQKRAIEALEKEFERIVEFLNPKVIALKTDTDEKKRESCVVS